eukprot:Sspe_Gene.55637::Locus_30592_Transcript_1_1_Confidence_1.000_Length_1326::g.55637::m.55637
MFGECRVCRAYGIIPPEGQSLPRRSSSRQPSIGPATSSPPREDGHATPSRARSQSRMEPLIAPCRCRGSLKHCHEECLLQWLRIVEERLQPLKCEICCHPFRVKLKRRSILQSTDPIFLSFVPFLHVLFLMNAMNFILPVSNAYGRGLISIIVPMVSFVDAAGLDNVNGRVNELIVGFPISLKRVYSMWTACFLFFPASFLTGIKLLAHAYEVVQTKILPAELKDGHPALDFFLFIVVIAPFLPHFFLGLHFVIRNLISVCRERIAGAIQLVTQLVLSSIALNCNSFTFQHYLQIQLALLSLDVLVVLIGVLTNPTFKVVGVYPYSPSSDQPPPPTD